MANESRLSITIDSRSAEQQAQDLEKALVALDDAGIRVVGTTTKAGRSSATAGRSFLGAGNEARQGARGIDDMNQSLRETDERAATAAATIGRTLKAAIAGFSVMHVIDTADEWGQYASRIRMATESAEEYEHVQKRMGASAQVTYRAINETRESFIQLSPVLRDMGLTLDQSIDAVDTFSGLLVVNGANAMRSTAAMEALAKSFQRGRVDAQAWMTIYSTVDNIVQLLADSSGKTTTEIRKMGIEGRISAEMMAKALIDGNRQVLNAVEEMPTTVRDALQNLNTAFTEYVGWGNEARGITAGLASGVGVLANNFEAIADIIGITAAGALFIYTARTIESTKASIAAFTARAHEAKRTLDSAEALAADTAATLANARAKLGLTTNLAQVTAATKAHEAAVKQLAVAQAGYTRAGMALLGVLGGPVGLGVTAAITAASFLVYRNSADDAGQATKSLTHEVNLLTEAADKLTAAQTSQAIAQMEEPYKAAQEEAMKYRAQVEYLTKQLAQFPSSAKAKEWNADLVQARGNADTAAQAVEKYEARLAELRARLDAVTGAQQAANAAMGELPDAVAKQLSALDKQIALFGKTGQAAQVYYDLERGALKDLSPEHKELIRVQADVLAGKEKEAEARRLATKVIAAEAKEIDGLLKSLRDQAAVLGMTEGQAARYRIETAKGTEAQRQEALALLDTVQAHKAAEQARKLETDAMREQRNLAAEIAVFRDQQELSITGLGLGERRRQELEQEYAVREEFARRRRELDEAQLVETTRMSEEAYRQQVEYLKAAEEEKISILQQSAARRLMAEQSWITGAREGLRNYADEAANAYRTVSGAVSNAFKGMEDALASFVTTGKMDFKSFADSIIADMARIAIQQSITGPLAGMLGGLFGGGGSSAPAGVTPGVDWTFGGGRANGGPVSAGKMYEVNERGDPELLNIGKRQYLMMGPDSGHVTPVGAGSSGGSTSAAPSVQVNVINQSSQPVQAKQGPLRMDAVRGWVQDIVLSDLRVNGPIARGMKGAMA